MAKFHTNLKTGVTNACGAQEGNCPLEKRGEEVVHSDSIREARAKYEQYMEQKGTQFMTITKNDTKPDTQVQPTPASMVGVEIPMKESERIDAEFNKVVIMLKAATKHPKFLVSPKWFDAIQKRRTLMYAKLAAEKDEFDALSDDEKKVILAQKADAEAARKARSVAWREKKQAENGDFIYHPEITTKNLNPVHKLMQSYSGKSEDEIRGLAQVYIDKGMSIHNAYQKVWSELPLRTDKAIVAVDIETADPLIDGKVDRGAFASIIELGYVRREPDGTKTEGTYMFGVPDNLMKVAGTGAVEIHHITPDMVKGLKPLVDDPEKTQEVLGLFKNSVMLAHNLPFEGTNFDHSLPGFKKMRIEGEIEEFDTQQACRFFCLNAVTNSNESFVEATGGKYEDAHEALPDARMSLESLERLKGL